jgi:hypothetical protein
MGAWELLLVGVVVLLGLCGVLVPGVPGSWLVWAAVAWWSLEDTRGLAWFVLVGATLVLLLSQAIRWGMPRRAPPWALPQRGLRKGGTPRMAVYAGTGAALGFVLVPVIGAIPGFMGGIYLSERLRLGRHREARAAVGSAMRSGGSSVLVELLACLLVAAAWIGAVVWG